MNPRPSKIMLIAGPRDAGAAGGAGPVRRFHLARLRHEDTAAVTTSRAGTSGPATRR
jgi:hypothetical protein